MLPVSILLGCLLWAVYFYETKSYRVAIEQKESSNTELQLDMIKAHFQNIVSDLMFLAGQHELHLMLSLGHKFSHADSHNDYLEFSLRKGIYGQIRVLDKNGMELVRVNYNNGEPFAVPEYELQNKGDRYYFKFL